MNWLQARWPTSRALGDDTAVAENAVARDAARRIALAGMGENNFFTQVIRLFE